jgi:hypothetical protein
MHPAGQMAQTHFSFLFERTTIGRRCSAIESLEPFRLQVEQREQK